MIQNNEKYNVNMYNDILDNFLKAKLIHHIIYF